MAAMVFLAGAGTAGAAESSRPRTTADTGAVASPKCGGTENYGPIRYQACVRYNCDSTSCFHRGYIGLINTATSARTVTWDLYWAINNGTFALEATGTVQLAAGQQMTIYAPDRGLKSACNVRVWRGLFVTYSSGTSPDPAMVYDDMSCR
ncbi:hypothetical protein [Amycolatopsis sp. TNS106]|uniref:hypothetical protein n=1 Tax=Amycolatopsis sp. TNS106 TaxID=2861750 RepID=UPI001C559621|nr:hypothetical protein [Amycolatopsis sp. TNS106]